MRWSAARRLSGVATALVAVATLALVVNSLEASPKQRRTSQRVSITISSAKAGREIEFKAVGTSTNIALAANPTQEIDSIVGKTPSNILVNLSRGPVEIVSHAPLVLVSVVVRSEGGEITASALALEVRWENNAVVVRGL